MKKQFAVTALLLSVAVSACVKKQEIVTPVSGGVAPTLVIEQFMRAANTNNLETMGRLFGTKDGPYWTRFPKQEVEQRMYAIATELRHTDFQITGEQMVPGRLGQATKLIVRLTKDDRKFDVPFTLVRYKESTWLVEQIGIEVLTAPRG